MSRKRVTLHGRLKEFLPETVEVEAQNVAEAIEIVTSQIPEMNQGARAHVKVSGVNSAEDLYRSDIDDIHIVPRLSGAKEGGVFQIVVGAALVAVGFILGGPGGGELAAAFILSGTATIIGGVIQLLMPSPEADVAEGDPEASKYLGSPKNTVKIGTRIPLLFGTDRAYGHFLSFDIDAKDVAV